MVRDLDAEADVDALQPVHLEQIALHARTVDLEARMEGQIDGTELAHLREGKVALRPVEEIADAVLGQVLLVQIAGEPLAAHQVVARDLHRGLAHLVGTRNVPLEQRDAQARQATAELPSEEVAGQASPQHCDVDVGAHTHRIPPLTERTCPVM
jgi:hypothetical protein